MSGFAQPSRREFLGALGAGSIATLSRGISPETSAAIAPSDMLFASGLMYFGTATLGPCSRKVVEATTRAWYELETNPTAMGYGDGATRTAAERVRGAAAEFVGCSVDEMVITRSTTDGMNAVAQGLQLTAGQRVLTTDQEHEGGSYCWLYLAERIGVVVDVVRIPPGENDTRAILDRFAAAITSDTRVISVSHVLASTGLRMPIAELSTLARSKGILCVVDGAQAVGGIHVDVKSLGCHVYATSGHKWLMGPKGTGLLYLSSEVQSLVKPIQLHDTKAFYSESSGVGNLPGAVGLGVAIESLRATGAAEVERHNVALRNRIYDGLKQIRAVTVVSPAPGPLATPLVSFALPGQIDSVQFRDTLRQKHHIEVKVVPKRWLNGIRLSPHIFNTEKEVDAVLKALRAELP